MKIWNSEYTFNYPWETVAQAVWRKYPNPKNTAVIGTDVIERKLIEGILYTHRLVLSLWDFPPWSLRFSGPIGTCYASEVSQVDSKKKQMICKTKNISLSNFIDVDETLWYTSHPSDPQKTLLKQEAIVTVRGLPLCGWVESFLTKQIASNAGKGHQAIEWVIRKTETEVPELINQAVKSTKKSIHDYTNSAKKSMDELSSAAKESFDSFTSPPNHNIPKF